MIASAVWTGTVGNDVDVNVLMSNYAGVPISINNAVLGSTARQLMNEQKAPQLYGLAEYILYTLINTAIAGSTRFSNDGVTTATIKAASAFVDPTFGVGHFNVGGATLKTFVSDLPAAMDLSKFPGGDEDVPLSGMALSEAVRRKHEAGAARAPPADAMPGSARWHRR